jgi:hypothetical protein
MAGGRHMGGESICRSISSCDNQPDAGVIWQRR